MLSVENAVVHCQWQTWVPKHKNQFFDNLADFSSGNVFRRPEGQSFDLNSFNLKVSTTLLIHYLKACYDSVVATLHMSYNSTRLKNCFLKDFYLVPDWNVHLRKESQKSSATILVNTKGQMHRFLPSSMSVEFYQ